jgi:hypothetical protein
MHGRTESMKYKQGIGLGALRVPRQKWGLLISKADRSRIVRSRIDLL